MQCSAALRIRLAAGLAAGVLAGCGVSVGIGVGDDDGWDDIPPDVTITSPVTTIQAGAPITFVANASDPETGIDDVRFDRVDGGVFTALGSDGSSPYDVTTTVPDDGRTTLVVFASARDNAGNTTDSTSITIAVTPAP
jgi:hypothetical protein